MGQHAQHDMHENSLKAYSEEVPKLGTRARNILHKVTAYGKPCTDRMVMGMMGFVEPNSVRPRITELVRGGFLEEGDKVRDRLTNKTVRTVRAPSAQLRLI